MGEADEPNGGHARRDLLVSVALLALAFAAVLCGLAYEENWRKLLRVGVASSVYLSALLLLTRRWRRAGAGAALALWPFAAAAAAAELCSGWLRTSVAPGLTFWLAPAAAALVGGVHWLALRRWRPLRERLTGHDAALRARQNRLP